jgi:hypothetical protein
VSYCRVGSIVVMINVHTHLYSDSGTFLGNNRWLAYDAPKRRIRLIVTNRSFSHSRYSVLDPTKDAVLWFLLLL